MMEQVRLCAVWPMENWCGSSLNQIQGWTTVRESYSRALEQEPLIHTRSLSLRGSKGGLRGGKEWEEMGMWMGVSFTFERESASGGAAVA